MKSIFQRAKGLYQKSFGKPYEALLNIDEDAAFNCLYVDSLKETDTEHRPARKARMFHLHSLMDTIASIEGDIVECGCWKGASAHLMMSTMQNSGQYTEPKKLWLFDSFQGLSQPNEFDSLMSGRVAKLFNKEIGKPFKSMHSYSCGKARVDSNLKKFKKYFSSTSTWIDASFPELFGDLFPGSISFANIDLDLYEPTYWAFVACLGKLAPGGILCCDDYGSLSWPGARKAVDKVISEYSMKKVELSSGQALLFF